MVNTKRNYREGQIVTYLLKKHIELSDKEGFFILEDQLGRKQLMKSEFYDKYNFKIGQYINCRIDHINCSGKIFLEPEHPFYKEGKFYDFVIDKIKKSQNRLDDDVLRFSFIDKIGNHASCTIEDDIENYIVDQKISCKVERIKKGKLYLSFANDASIVKFKRGEYYKFKIIDIQVLNDGFRYYILTDEAGRKYLLKHDYYNHHEFEKGQTIDCTIIKFSSKGFYVLEPKHPFYEIGETYDFEFVKQEKDAKGSITGNYDVTVSDVYGDEVKFISEKSLVLENNIPGKIFCKVTGVKKGKPLLNF